LGVAAATGGGLAAYLYLSIGLFVPDRFGPLMDLILATTYVASGAIILIHFGWSPPKSVKKRADF
jgi:hypothetical protein